MTVSTEVDHNDYTGNGVTTAFPYTFRIYKKSDLLVTVVDLEENITELVLDTNYTVTGAGTYQGGNVVLTAPLANGWKIAISRELPVTQETDLRNQGKFFAEVHEDALDKLTMLIQQALGRFSLALRKPSSIANYYDALGNYIRNLRDPKNAQDAATKNYVDMLVSGNNSRTLRVPEPIPPLPEVEIRKNKMVAFDDGGNPIVVVPPSGSASDVMVELGKPTGAGAIGYQYKNNPSASKRKVSSVLDERCSLWDFHCDTNGNVIQPGAGVDSRPYIQRAIDALSAIGGGTLTIPQIAGKWYLGSYGTGAIAGHSGILQLRSNVNLCIEGTIQLTSFFDLKSFQVFVGFDNADPSASGNLTNCHIYGGGVIDFGGFNFNSSSQLRNGLTMGRSYNCSISNITFQNGDMTWAITMGWNGYGSDCVAVGCKFKNLVTSTTNPDHSTIYVNCPHSGVEKCSFEMSSARGHIIACTVELHQHSTWYRDSTIVGYCRGCYVVMHAAEAAGAGLYSYNLNVSGITGEVYGQFCILGSDESDGQYAHLSCVLVSRNNVRIAERAAFSAPFGAFIDIGPDNAGRRNVQDISSVLVDGNIFTAPANVQDSAAITINANLNGIVFSNNIFDCRYAIYGDANTSAVEVRNLVWEETNTIGKTHTGTRTSLNLCEMRFALLNSSKIDFKLSSEDLSMFSVLYFPSTCAVTYSVIKLAADFTAGLTNAVIFDGGQQAGANVYAKYPANISFTTYANSGPVAFFSTGATFSWVTSAHPLTGGGTTDYQLPAAWTAKSNGQLIGIGFNETGLIRTGDVRLMLSRKI
ncbi:phage tailspike protein [Escherichia coli]